MIWKAHQDKRFSVIIVALLGVLYLLTLNPFLGIMGDNAQYITLAKSMVSGNGFCNINFPDSPPETRYGFGYPLLIAPVVYFLPDNVIALKLVTVLFTIFSLFAIYRLFGKLADFPTATIIMILSGVSHYVLEYSHQVMTEIPYLFFSIMAIYFVESYSETDSRVNKHLFLGGLFLAMSYFVRTVGVFLFIAAFGYLFFKRKVEKAALILLCFLVLAGPWFLRNHAIPERATYSAEFMLKNPYDPEQGTITLSTMWERFVSGARHHRHHISSLLGYNGQRGWMFLLPIAMFGFIVSGKRKLRFHHIYVPLYFLVVFLWYWRVPRFIVPVVPFIFYYFFSGLVHIYGRKRQIGMVARNLAFLVILVLSFQQDVMIVRREQRPYYYSPQWENYFRIADWVRENVPEESLVMCRKPYLFFLRSARKTVEYPFTRDAEKIVSAIRENEVSYVVLDGFAWTSTTRRYLYPAVLKNKDMFETVVCTGAEPRTLLLRVKLRNNTKGNSDKTLN